MSEDSDLPDFSPIDPIWRKHVLDPGDARAQRTGVGPFHPHLVERLRRRVGSDGLLMEDGLDWIWQRLPARLRKAEAVSELFLRVVFERLVLDFLNHQFGRHEPPKGVLAKGGVWLVAFRLIFHQRLDSQSVIGNLTTNHGLDQLEAMRVIRETLYLSRNSDWGGQRKGRSVSINADEGVTLECELRDVADVGALMSRRFPRLFPPIWAVAWGDDRFGLWAELDIESVAQRLRWIEPGEFWMGSPEDETERYEDEGPQHRVRISEGFWLADSACTQALWLAVMGGNNPSWFAENPQNPVEKVSWDDVQAFLRRLQAHLPPGSEVVLPTEAQWEYACRAGTTTPFNLGASISPDQANYDGNYPYASGAKGKFRGRTVPVKSLLPNRWGLFEMHGNVWEWCADGIRDYGLVKAGEVVVDPIGPTESFRDSWRTGRGGSWFDLAERARSAYRYLFEPGLRNENVGFRLALRS